jgi:2'-5' RNA ligase
MPKIEPARIEPGIRLFIATDPPDEARQVLADTIRDLELAIPDGVHWVQTHRIHLTLKFLGNVPPSMVDGVDGILAAMQQASNDFSDGNFNLSLSKLGVFPDQSRPRVLWAGVQGDLGPLESLHHAVDHAVSRLGFSADRGPYRPHLTLGRPRNAVAKQRLGVIGETVANWPSLRPVTWEVDAVHLMHSVSEPGRIEYVRLGSASL